METKTVENLLENPPSGMEPIADLIAWSYNYEHPTPYSLFLDMVGYSDEYFGVALCGDKVPALGYVEMDYLADALKVWAARPLDAGQYVLAIDEAERED